MRVLPQALEIILGVQRKKGNEKNNKKKNKLFNLQNVFFFPSLWTLTFKPNNLKIYIIHFKRFKVPWEHHLKFYKSFLNSNSNKVTYKELFWLFKNRPV
jgi:hypothetical protein